MRAFVHRANRLLAGFAGWLMVAMMLLLVTDIVFRTGNRPLHGLAEVSVFVMMVVIYLGFSRCEEYREHVRLDIVVRFLSRPARRLLAAVVQFLAAATVALMFHAVTMDAWSAYVTGSAIEGLVDLPIWPTKFVMVLGMSLFLAQSVINLVDAVRASLERAPPEVSET